MFLLAVAANELLDAKYHLSLNNIVILEQNMWYFIKNSFFISSFIGLTWLFCSTTRKVVPLSVSDWPNIVCRGNLEWECKHVDFMLAFS